MELERRKPKRKPLSDCTNITNTPRLSSSSTFLTTKKPNEYSFKHDARIVSNNAENPSVRKQPSTPPQPKSSANSVAVDCENSGIVTVYSRRQTVERTKDKGKAVAVAVPFSCPPARRIGSIEDKLNIEHGDRGNLNAEDEDVGISKTCTVPRPKSKKKRRYLLPKEHALPQDFIDKQRTYFAEIDAFNLLEEVVSESELE